MGDNKNLSDEEPAHPLSISSLYVDVKEVHIWHWEKVAKWAELNGYEFSDSSLLRKDGPYWYTENSELIFPMNMISWYDAVKWCNARSELEGRVPLYYLDDDHTLLYKTGDIDLNNSNVKWTASGYRLPTEGEWEYFSRNTRTGKVVRVNMERMIRKLEEFTGESFMEEWYEDPTD